MKENMNKSILILSVILLSACKQLMHGEMQPVKQISTKGVYMTTCAGAVEDWPSCYDKASATCNGKYDVITREDNNRGTKRELTFQCRK
jgi:predicted lipoprotein with Yx(FWY)xxD motif